MQGQSAELFDQSFLEDVKNNQCQRITAEQFDTVVTHLPEPYKRLVENALLFLVAQNNFGIRSDYAVKIDHKVIAKSSIISLLRQLFVESPTRKAPPGWTQFSQFLRRVYFPRYVTDGW